MQFDYVIVGGGSAGCVLADRLSACGRHTVCLIEAGPRDNDLRIKLPFGLIGLMGNPKFDWGFKSAPHGHLDGRVASVPRGKVLGGSGSINSMVYIRGRSSDYDRWAELGCAGWDWESVLPYFKRQEQNDTHVDPLHGREGPLHVQNMRSPHHLTQRWIEAGTQLQIPPSDDFNGAQQEGLGVYQATMRAGRRWSAADAFLRSALKRSNLSVLTGCTAEQITFEGRRASGVILQSGGEQLAVSVTGELILAAGAIGSPELLLRSGIGPAEHLKHHGIEPVLDSPVGRNLHDHPATAVFHGGGKHGYGLTLSAIPSFAFAPIRYALARTGLLASNTVEAGGFAKTRPDLEEPNVQFHFIPARLGHQGSTFVYGRGYYCDVCLLKPTSRGALSLTGPNIDDPIKIDLNLLSDPDDFDQLAEGFELLRRLMAAPAFDRVRSAELFPGPNVSTREDVIAHIKRNLGTAYHPVGTCRMGAESDPGSVVAPDTNVIGLQNLRVVDASIMPEIVAGNTNAPTMMIAEKASDVILSA